MNPFGKPGWAAAVTAAVLLPAAGARADEAPRVELPLKQVALFTSGVAFFERSAELDGAAQAELAFKTEQINDLIKSLVLIDEGGGRVSAATYESREPAERTLQAFSVDLSDNPDLGLLLNRLRGVRVRVKAAARDWTGVIVGVETRQRRDGETVFEEKLLNLMTEQTLRALPLDSLQEIEPLDPAIRADLAAALQVLAGSHDQSRKAVRLAFQGEKRRRVRAGYMLEAPVWKTSYRLVLGEKDPPFLQSWAHVENMTDEDWSGITLSLVSGRPLSFIQNLYDPLYRRRPEVKPEYDENLAPPEFEGELKLEMAAAPASAPRAMMKARRAVKPAAPDESAAAGGAGLMGIDADSLAGAAPAQAEAREAGELFEFAVKEPVFLPRRQSAMIPIVNQALAGDKLSLFNAGVNARHPLNGLELENTSGLFLMQGPVTVFEEGRYAGEARLPDTQRGEKRLLAYALDLAAEGKLERRSAPAEVVSLRILRGVLHLQRKRVDTATYTLKNKRDRERVFLIEHPLRPDWELAEPAKGVDKTREAYRWRVTLGGGQSREIPFVEQRLEPEQIILSNIPSELILVYVNQKAASAKLRDALKAVVSQQNELHATRQAMAEKEERVKAIAQDQNRMRENMRAVARNSESYLMWEGKMVAQEKQLDGLNRELETLRAKAQQQEAALARFLEGLNAE